VLCGLWLLVQWSFVYIFLKVADGIADVDLQLVVNRLLQSNPSISIQTGRFEPVMCQICVCASMHPVDV